jgi:hypothetical protein
MEKDDTVDTIIRREASSGRVSYSDPMVLHESRVQRVVLVPIYVPRRVVTGT